MVTEINTKVPVNLNILATATVPEMGLQPQEPQGLDIVGAAEALKGLLFGRHAAPQAVDDETLLATVPSAILFFLKTSVVANALDAVGRISPRFEMLRVKAANIYMQEGQLAGLESDAKAIKYLTRSIGILNSLSDKASGTEMKMDVLALRGGIYDRSAEHGSALKDYNEVIALARKINSPTYEVEFNVYIGQVHAKMGNFVAADASFSEADTIFSRHRLQASGLLSWLEKERAAIKEPLADELLIDHSFAKAQRLYDGLITALKSSMPKADTLERLDILQAKMAHAMREQARSFDDLREVARAYSKVTNLRSLDVSKGKAGIYRAIYDADGRNIAAQDAVMQAVIVAERVDDVRTLAAEFPEHAEAIARMALSRADKKTSRTPEFSSELYQVAAEIMRANNIGNGRIRATALINAAVTAGTTAHYARALEMVSEAIDILKVDEAGDKELELRARVLRTDFRIGAAGLNDRLQMMRDIGVDPSLDKVNFDTMLAKGDSYLSGDNYESAEKAYMLALMEAGGASKRRQIIERRADLALFAGDVGKAADILASLIFEDHSLPAEDVVREKYEKLRAAGAGSRVVITSDRQYVSESTVKSLVLAYQQKRASWEEFKIGLAKELGVEAEAVEAFVLEQKGGADNAALRKLPELLGPRVMDNIRMCRNVEVRRGNPDPKDILKKGK